MLFCVTTRGRERIFSSPRDSTNWSRKSMRMLLVAFTIWKPLVGDGKPKFENSGICDPLVPPPETMYSGLGTKPLLTAVGVVPTPCTPPMAVGPLPQDRKSV